MGQPEYDKTEEPLIDQLVAMGWKHVRGGPPGEPATLASASGRTSFTQVVYEDRFRDAVARRAPPLAPTAAGLGSPRGSWTTFSRVSREPRPARGSPDGARPVLRSDRHAPERHQRPYVWLDPRESRTHPPGRLGRRVRSRRQGRKSEGSAKGNDLLAVSQFRVERKGAKPVTPDLVLFVNGLPWVVIECKAPLLTERTAGPRWMPPLIRSSATRVPVRRLPSPSSYGTRRCSSARIVITPSWLLPPGRKHFAPWRTVRPRSEANVRADVGKSESTPLTAQDVLVAGLDLAHLFTLVRDFTTWAGHGNRAGRLSAATSSSGPC
ncbi:hypothetical protein SMICM304S_07606 [Streptomyces microflavus]